MNELDRLNFIAERDSIEESVVFAKRTMVLYRRAVLNSHMRSPYRRSFIESYLIFKKYIKQNKTKEHNKSE